MKTNRKLLLLTIILGTVFSILHIIRSKEKQPPWYIAVAGPLTGRSANNGKSMIQGVQLYLDKLNQQGGVLGRKIELIPFDDKNDPVLAKKVAQKLVDQNRFLAVIGHNFSAASITAGDIYKKNEIAAITPTSTQVRLTANNDWFFRATFNDRSQSRFLANIMKKVLRQNRVTVIYENRSYGSYLANIFIKTSQEQGVTLNKIYPFDLDKAKSPNYLNQVVKKLKQQGNKSGAIFIASQSDMGVRIIKAIKDAGITNIILTPDSFAGEAIQKSFINEPKEKIRPGFYTEDLYVSTPLIFDTANEKAQQFREEYRQNFEEEPDWRAAFSYDSALLITNAIQYGGLNGEQGASRENRKKIRDYLAGLDNINKSIAGVTGFNYFDHKGDSHKPISLGVYKWGNIVSALTQVKDIRDFSSINDLEKELQAERILKINNKYHFKTNVVYTGIKIKEISELDLSKLECVMEFVLWFRYRQNGNIKPENIEFLNAVEPIALTPIKEDNIDRGAISYRPYHVKGRFKVDYLNNSYTFRRHDLGIRFRHRKLPHASMIYVNDELGMGLNRGHSLTEKLRKSGALNPALEWTIANGRIYQDMVYEDSQGNPDFLKASNGKVEYSRFNLNIQIEKKNFTLRGISHEYLYPSFVGSAVMLSLLLLLGGMSKQRVFRRILFLFQLLFIAILMLSGEEVLLQYLKYQLNSYELELIIITFDVLWWLIPAWLFNQGFELFIWSAVEQNTGRKIPQILRRFLSLIVYILALFGIVAFVYDQRLTGLLATSGVFAMIIGLAIQMNISNIFSGIAINVERPFRINDWVKIGENTGQVVDINWRSTRITQSNGSILSIPNSLVSDSTIRNFNYPDNLYRQNCTIHMATKHSPERVKKLLYDAVIASEDVLKTPSPTVQLRELAEWSTDYSVDFCINDFENRIAVKEQVLQKIWTHLNHAGLSPAIQQQEIHLFRGEKEPEPALLTSDEKAEAALKKSTVLQSLTKHEKRSLLQQIQEHTFYPQERVTKQGHSGKSLFLIVEGVVSLRNVSDPEEAEKVVTLRNVSESEKTERVVSLRHSSEPEMVERELLRLGAGHLFGAMTLTTETTAIIEAIAISKLTVYEISREAMLPIIESNREIANQLYETLTEREKTIRNNLKQQNKKTIQKLSSPFRKRMDRFINLFSGKKENR